MELLSKQLDFSASAAPLPAGVSDELYDMCRSIYSPDTARQVLEKLRPLLGRYRADKNLAIACGLLFEKQRADVDMVALWSDLQALFPDDAMALRMLMRWYRRHGKTEAGIDHIRDLYPNRWTVLAEAKTAVAALAELKAWDEIDAIMDGILDVHSGDRSMRMAYIKVLNEQSRFLEAAEMASHVYDRGRMGQASQDLLALVERKAEVLRTFRRTRPADLIDDIVRLAGPPRPHTETARVVFFSGQLGTGGAERQMTRLACGFQKNAGSDGPTPEVWVKHANPATGADFFRPTLAVAGVRTRVMTEEPETPIEALDGVSETLKDILSLIAPDIRRHTGQLVRMFRENNTDVAYLWQDGGIVQSAIAAIVAGVPRIVTSFRGLPPNLRRHFFRDELPVLYTALARLPHVTFTANSQKTATAYEAWLGLAPGTVIVVPNATPPVLPEGDITDVEQWDKIVSASPDCSKTVLGVFRFDENKRPLQWIEAAERHLSQSDDTRFVLLGNGPLFHDCARQIEDRNLSDRVFLAGIRNHVGFYMHRADLVMHLAQMEGLPNVLIEAQLAGTPVLATPAGGTDEVVSSGLTGVLLSEAQTLPEAELDRVLSEMLADPLRLAEMGTAAKEHSGERFAEETILRRTNELFETSKMKSR